MTTPTPPSSRQSTLELNYATVAVNVSVTSATEAAPTDVVSVPARTYSGSEIILVEFSCTDALVSANAAGNGLIVNLWDMDGPTNLGRLCDVEFPLVGAFETALYLVVRLTPAAGQHTYRARAWRRNDACLLVGTGFPIFLRVTRVAT